MIRVGLFLSSYRCRCSQGKGERIGLPVARWAWTLSGGESERQQVVEVEESVPRQREDHALWSLPEQREKMRKRAFVIYSAHPLDTVRHTLLQSRQQGVQLWCAPTVDAREIGQSSMRHIAYEGRCFVLSACQFLTKDDWQQDLREAGGEIDGRSLVVSPRGEIISGPAEGERLLTADLDLGDIPRGKFDLDVAGHYNRPDVFTFHSN
jgi:hypothetical protein